MCVCNLGGGWVEGGREGWKEADGERVCGYVVWEGGGWREGGNEGRRQMGRECVCV